MLSDNGYKILQLIKKDSQNEILDMDTFSFLESRGHIDFDGQRRAYVTPQGDEACKDYEIQMAARQTADKAEKSARKSNRISIAALVVSTIISLAAVLVAAFC